MLSLPLRYLLLFSVAFLTATNTANACSCGPRPTVLKSFDESDEVVVLRAISVEKVENKEVEDENYVDGVKSTTMIVDKVFKGKLKVRDEIVFGVCLSKTDDTGRFTLTVLKGLTGELSAEHWLMKGLFKNCPKVDELIAQSEHNNVTVYSNVVKLTTEQDVYNVELTLPFPLCEKVKE